MVKTDQCCLCQSIVPHHAKMIKKKHWQIMICKVHKLSFALKGDFLGKLTNTSIVYLLCPIMLQCLKKILRIWQIMRYNVLQFWAKLDTNYPLMLKGNFLEKLTDVSFVYLMYPIIILQCLKWIIKVVQKIQGCITFGQIGLGHFNEKIDYSYFYQSCPIILKCLNEKKSLGRIIRFKVL